MIDLHMHTCNSDGTDTTEELLKIAESKKLEVISITDHDEINAYFEIEKNSFRSLFSGKIIPGIEVSTSYNKIMIEVLGYGIDYKKFNLYKIDLQNTQKIVMAELKEKATKLGLKFDPNINVDFSNPGKKFAGTLFGEELLKYEENEKIIEKIGNFNRLTFFRVHQSNPDSPLFIDESSTAFSIEDVIDRIHEAGGLAFLAHPFMYPFKDKAKTVEEILVNTKLDGLECEYVEFSREQRDILCDIAMRNKKLVSGGTDYHHKHKPDIEMGTGRGNNICIPREYIKDWENKVLSI